MPYASLGGDAERRETPAERLDRNWGELLQELRVTQTGVQILTGFLLTVPFQARFTTLSPFLVGVFVAAMALATLTTVVIVAPATAHRVLFRRHAKDVLVAWGNVSAKIGEACLAVTIALVLVLIVGFLAGTWWGVTAGVACLAVSTGLWLILPVAVATRATTSRPGVDEPRPG